MGAAGRAGPRPSAPSTTAAARMSPLCTSAMRAIPPFAFTEATSAVSCCSTWYCNPRSRVRTMSRPAWAGTSLRSVAGISLPLGSRSASRRPARPASVALSPNSTPPPPVPEPLTKPMTGPARSPFGMIRRVPGSSATPGLSRARIAASTRGLACRSSTTYRVSARVRAASIVAAGCERIAASRTAVACGRVTAAGSTNTVGRGTETARSAPLRSTIAPRAPAPASCCGAAAVARAGRSARDRSPAG